MSFNEEAAIGNTLVDHMYKSDWAKGNGNYFSLVIEENGDKSIEYSPPFPSRNRIKIKVTFVKASAPENDEIKEVEFLLFKEFTTKGISRWENIAFSQDNPIAMTHFSFEKVCQFLEFLTQHDLRSVSERRLRLTETLDGPIDASTSEIVSRLLKKEGGTDLVREILQNGSITSSDLVNVGYRKAQLAIFDDLMNSEDAILEYCNKWLLDPTKIEKMWQHFFSSNRWIFGFGLDYQFLGVLQQEANLGLADLSGSGSPITDFLLGARNFTVIVELKKPNTPLFKANANRAGSWSLSNLLFDSCAQILEQKAAWQIKSELNNRNSSDSEGNFIKQRTADPKAILVIGSLRDITGTEVEKSTKLRTFELFRRDSRNIDVVTFDELFERAKFIVNGD
jgi:hypothetical protein